MVTIDATEQEKAAGQAYEGLHVPALFRQFAPLVAEAAGVKAGQRVLDVACGSGVLAREMASIVGSQAAVSGLDATPGMLAAAQELAPDIDWHLGMADKLPFDDATFDAVTCQFGMMFFPDRGAAVSEMLRVLKPDGRVAVAVWDSLERSEAYPDAVALLQRRAGSDAANALRAPFVLGDRGALVRIFEDAGAQSIEVHTHHGRSDFPSITAMVEADLRGWLPVMGVHLSEGEIAGILVEAEQVLGQYVSENGKLQFDTPAHILSAKKA